MENKIKKAKLAIYFLYSLLATINIFISIFQFREVSNIHVNVPFVFGILIGTLGVLFLTPYKRIKKFNPYLNSIFILLLTLNMMVLILSIMDLAKSEIVQDTTTLVLYLAVPVITTSVVGILKFKK